MLSEQEERRRVSELIHDGPVQQLSAISQMLDAGLADLESGESDRAREVFARGLELARDAARDLRQLCDDLEPRVLHQLGFASAAGALARRLLVSPRHRDRSRCLRMPTRSVRTQRSRFTRSSARPPSRQSSAGKLSRIEIAVRPTRGRRHRARRRRRRPPGAPSRSARRARRARRDAQRPVQLGGAPSTWTDHPGRRAPRRGASLGSPREREREDRLSLLRLVTCRLHAHRANR